MAQWTMTDSVDGAPLFAPELLNQKSTPDSRTNLFADMSILGIDPNEATNNKSLPGSGWILKKTGTGGRAGRVSYEILVASGSITGGAGYVPPVIPSGLIFTTSKNSGYVAVLTL